jgi:hypothetical protein
MAKNKRWFLGLLAAVAAAGPAAAVAVADNGVASLSPSAILAATSKAVAGLKSVHVAGALSSGGEAISFNLDIVSGEGGKGSMSEGGLSFQIIDAGKYVYINASPSFWKHFGGAAAATLFAGKWLKAPSSGQFSSLAALTSVSKLFSSLLNTKSTLTRGSVTTVDGQSVVPLTDKVHGGTLYVATNGQPYPIEISKSGASGGKIQFSKFGESIKIAAPAHSIDLSQLK